MCIPAFFHSKELYLGIVFLFTHQGLYTLCSLIHAYAVGRDMEEALSCVRKMKEEGIEMSLVTYSILVGGFAKIGNAE